jgi:hypothetical protein
MITRKQKMLQYVQNMKKWEDEEAERSGILTPPYLNAVKCNAGNCRYCCRELMQKPVGFDDSESVSVNETWCSFVCDRV